MKPVSRLAALAWSAFASWRASRWMLIWERRQTSVEAARNRYFMWLARALRPPSDRG